MQVVHCPEVEQMGMPAGQLALLPHWGLATSVADVSVVEPSTGTAPSAVTVAHAGNLDVPSHTQTCRSVSHLKPGCTEVQSVFVSQVTVCDFVGRQLAMRKANGKTAELRILEPQGKTVGR